MGMHKSQLFFYLVLAFLVGIFTASFIEINFPVLTISLLAITGFIVLIPEFKGKLVFISLIILCFSLGIIRYKLADTKESQLDLYIGQQITISGYIDSEPKKDGAYARFYFKAKDVNEKGINEKISIITSSYPERFYGDFITIDGTLERPSNFSDFDYISFLKKEGVYTVISFPRRVTDELSTLSIFEQFKINAYRQIFYIKQKFQDSVSRTMSEPNSSFVSGILLGSRQNIPDDVENAFRKTGTTHILAISGYNIMIIAEAVLLGLTWFFRRRKAFWISVFIIAVFTVMTGASASVVRASLMGLLILFAHGYGRLYDQKNSIILAGALMVILNPLILRFDVGFQLSFLAVLGIVYLYPWLDKKNNELVPIVVSIKSKLQNRGSSISQSNQDDLREIGTGLKELILMTLSAQTAVLPLILINFGTFSPVFLPANILILPFIPFAMLAGFLAGLGGMIWLPLGRFFGLIAWAITEYQISVVGYLARLF
jgi:competence protein ComEC